MKILIDIITGISAYCVAFLVYFSDVEGEEGTRGKGFRYRRKFKEDKREEIQS